MPNYLLLFHGGGMPETEAEVAQVMAAWGAWYEKLGGGVVDPGDPTFARKMIAPDGTVSDADAGPSGYTIIAAGSTDEAVALASDCPILAGGGAIQVCETMPVM